jgi:hypothetical protein
MAFLLTFSLLSLVIASTNPEMIPYLSISESMEVACRMSRPKT